MHESPEEPDPQRQKVGWWSPGAGAEGETGSWCLTAPCFSVGRGKSSGDGRWWWLQENTNVVNASLPESSSSSQGFNLKGWAVLAREKLRQPLSFLGLPVYFKLMILFYTFTKALGQRFGIFSSHWPRFIFLQKSLLPLKRSSFLSDCLIYSFSCVLVNTL